MIINRITPEEAKKLAGGMPDCGLRENLEIAADGGNPEPLYTDGAENVENKPDDWLEVFAKLTFDPFSGLRVASRENPAKFESDWTTEDYPDGYPRIRVERYPDGSVVLFASDEIYVECWKTREAAEKDEEWDDSFFVVGAYVRPGVGWLADSSRNGRILAFPGLLVSAAECAEHIKEITDAYASD